MGFLVAGVLVFALPRSGNAVGILIQASNKIRLGNSAVTVIEGAVSFTYPSDRAKKENFRPSMERRVL